MALPAVPCLVSACLCLAVAGCAPLSGDTTVETADGRIELSESGKGTPAVVFEAGLLGYKEGWNKVFPAIAEITTAFAYDRPGVGRSTTTTRPRDGATIVEDLRVLLRSHGLQPPYVLVGHSLGGLYLQLYARRYPGEVAGLVLVDPTHPTQFEGAGAMGNRPALAGMVMSVALTGPSKAEFAATPETGREVLSAPPLRSGLPIIILVAPDRTGSDIASYDNAERRDFANLYPGAELREVNGGPDIPQERPQVVIDAIRDVLRGAVRLRSRAQR